MARHFSPATAGNADYARNPKNSHHGGTEIELILTSYLPTNRCAHLAQDVVSYTKCAQHSCGERDMSQTVFHIPCLRVSVNSVV